MNWDLAAIVMGAAALAIYLSYAAGRERVRQRERREMDARFPDKERAE